MIEDRLNFWYGGGLGFVKKSKSSARNREMMDLNTVFAQAAESIDQVVLEQIASSTLHPETVFSAIEKTGNYSLYSRFSFLLEGEENANEITALMVRAIEEGKQGQLPASLFCSLHKTHMRESFARACGHRGFRKGLEWIPVPDQTIEKWYLTSVLEEDRVDEFALLCKNTREDLQLCVFHGSLKCIDYLLSKEPDLLEKMEK